MSGLKGLIESTPLSGKLNQDGTYKTNPTINEAIAKSVKNQEELVRRVSDNQGKIITKEINFLEPNAPFQGLKFILDGEDSPNHMNKGAIIEFCKNLVRYRSNMLALHIKFGDYPGATECFDYRINELDSLSSPLPLIELGNKIGQIFANRELRIVELLFQVENAVRGQYRVSCKALAAPSEEVFFNKEHFDPKLAIRHLNMNANAYKV